MAAIKLESGTSMIRPRTAALAFAAIASLLCPSFIQAGESKPFAEWVETENLDEPTRKIALALRKHAIPLEEQVPIPKFPRSKLLSLVFNPSILDGQLENFMVLVSRDSLASIDAWYSENLVGYSRHDLLNDDGRRKIYFLKGHRSLNVQENYHDLAYTRHVIVSEILPGLRRLAPGYNTSIVVSY